MKRLPDWRSRLHAAVEEWRRRSFSWDGADCAIFAADCIKAMTGEDPAEAYRGKYQSDRAAIRLIRAGGFADLGDFVADLLDEIDPPLARVGDVAFIPDESAFGGALGVVIGEQVACLSKEGVGVVDRSLMTRAFAVP